LRGETDTDVPVWNPATSTLVGNVKDTAGASGWLRPTAAIRTLILTSTVQSGIPAHQVWIAAFDEPAASTPPPTAAGTPGGDPGAPVTDPGSAVTIPIDLGPNPQVSVVGPPDHGTVGVNGAGALVYTPKPGFVGEDVFTVRLVEKNGKVLVETFVVKVVAALPDTGADGLAETAATAFLLVLAGLGLARAGVRRTRRPQTAAP
jgi:hypothetical protein